MRACARDAVEIAQSAWGIGASLCSWRHLVANWQTTMLLNIATRKICGRTNLAATQQAQHARFHRHHHHHLVRSRRRHHTLRNARARVVLGAKVIPVGLIEKPRRYSSVYNCARAC